MNPMKIVLAPDSFKESMSATQAAAAMACGVRQVIPDAQCVEVPLADGGEGTMDALVTAWGGERRQVETVNALGESVSATFGLASDGTAVIEVAQAIGLGMIPPSRRDILHSTSSGVADLVRAALDAGAHRLVIGLGGTATNDGGAGLLTGLGAILRDVSGEPIDPTPSDLTRVETVDVSALDPRIGDTEMVVACDVTAPLLGPTGATAVFGPQKGATQSDLPLLESALTRYSAAMTSAMGRDLTTCPGAGAAGGLGFAFLVLGAAMRSGIDVVMEAAGVDRVVRDADLVMTGEGSVDAQTLAGKAPAGVARLAARHGVPVIAFAGRVDLDADQAAKAGFAAVVSIVPSVVDLPTALRDGPVNLERAAEMAMRLYLAGRTHRSA